MIQSRNWRELQPNTTRVILNGSTEVEKVTMTYRCIRNQLMIHRKNVCSLKSANGLSQ
jgi:hypothetical protein